MESHDNNISLLFVSKLLFAGWLEQLVDIYSITSVLCDCLVT